MSLKLLVINGPNLNMLGIREPAIYGAGNYAALVDYIKSHAKASDIDVTVAQSNYEGEIITQIQQALGVYQGIVINAGGYTHTSVVIRDAISAIDTPVVEIHISNIAAREEFRHTTLIGSVAIGSVVGFGLNSYRIGVEALKLHLEQ